MGRSTQFFHKLRGAHAPSRVPVGLSAEQAGASPAGGATGIRTSRRQRKCGVAAEQLLRVAQASSPAGKEASLPRRGVAAGMPRDRHARMRALRMRCGEAPQAARGAGAVPERTCELSRIAPPALRIRERNLGDPSCPSWTSPDFRESRPFPQPMTQRGGAATKSKEVVIAAKRRKGRKRRIR